MNYYLTLDPYGTEFILECPDGVDAHDLCDRLGLEFIGPSGFIPYEEALEE